MRDTIYNLRLIASYRRQLDTEKLYQHHRRLNIPRKSYLRVTPVRIRLVTVALVLAVDPERALRTDLVALLPEVARRALTIAGFSVTPAEERLNRI